MGKLTATSAKLGKAIKELEACSGGPRAKNNRRTAVLDLLREARHALDAEYPRLQQKKPRARRSSDAVTREMIAEGWEIVDRHVAQHAKKHGITVRWRRNQWNTESAWVRAWQLEILQELGKEALQAAIRNPAARKAAMAEIMLSSL
tara:strand:- start:162 stop:602 length:441 start_codon:yes stop_codon:yes gene_type:complete